MIKFEKVSKEFSDGFEAVKSLDLEIEKGEILVLIGPSGCGKTTTMKMINQLVPHTKGDIYFDGENIKKIDPVVLRRKVGYVIQQIGLFPHYTIEDNVALIPRLNKWKEEDVQARVKELLKMVELDPETYAKRYPGELSGGQQQRVGVIRALAANPEVILMDEPFAALDPLTREQLQDDLLKIQEEMKKTIIFVTHDMDEALKMGDRIAVMKDGELLQLDSPDVLLSHPAHGFVEDFIGKKRIYHNPEYVPITDIMRDNPATIRPNRKPALALNTMRQKKTDTLLVSDGDDRLLGIVAGNDLQRNINKVTSVNDLMRPMDLVLDHTATAKDALLIISDALFGVIPVVDEETKIVGVVTRGSLLSFFANQWNEDDEEEEI